MLGFICGRVSVTLTGNSDSWDVPPENKAAIFENLFNTQTKGFFRLSASRHCVQQAGSPNFTSACSRLLFSVTYTLKWLATVLHSPVVPPGHELILWRRK